MNLKAARERSGFSQAAAGKLIGKPQSTYSYVESGVIDLELEDMMILEREFGSKIDWPESLTAHEKAQALQALSSLAGGFPLRVVLKFAEKMLADYKGSSPVKKISFYARAAQSAEEGVYPPGVE